MFIDNDDDERKKGMNNITHIYMCVKREKKEKEEEKKKKKKKRVTRLEIQQAAHHFICLSLMAFSVTQRRFRMPALIFPIKH